MLNLDIFSCFERDVLCAMERSIVTEGSFTGIPRAYQPIKLYDPIFHSADPNDEMASCGGSENLEALAMIKTLEEAGIPCCVVNIPALKYFGAGRVRNVGSFRSASFLGTSYMFKHEFALLKDVTRIGKYAFSQICLTKHIPFY